MISRRPLFPIVAMLIVAAVACGSDNEPFAKDDTGTGRPTTSGTTKPIVQAAVGSAPEAVGIEIPEEGNPEGPSSFAVDAQGTVHILDQVNQRIQVYAASGAFTGSVPLSSATFEDIELDGKGGYILLDKSEREAVVFIDGAGKETSFLRVVGGPIDNAGDVTGLYRANDGIWLEIDDAALVQVADLAGNPVQTRTTELGRRDADGRIVLVSIDGTNDVILTARASGAADTTELGRIRFDMTVGHVSAFEYDDNGNVLVGVETYTEKQEGEEFVVSAIEHEIVTLNRAGKEISRDKLLKKDDPLTQLRYVRRGADGHLYQLKVGDTGAEVVRYVP
jgi:hypothetical protein